MKTLTFILVILVCIALLFAITFAKSNEDEKNHSAFTEPGICPTCGTPLVKGVYGQYFPNFIWYCPNCP